MVDPVESSNHKSDVNSVLVFFVNGKKVSLYTYLSKILVNNKPDKIINNITLLSRHTLMQLDVIFFVSHFFAYTLSQTTKRENICCRDTTCF